MKRVGMEEDIRKSFTEESALDLSLSRELGFGQKKNFSTKRSTDLSKSPNCLLQSQA